MAICQIINLVCKENEPSWKVPEKRRNAPSGDDGEAGRRYKRSRGSEDSGKSKQQRNEPRGKGGKKYTTAKCMANGREICEAWNSGSCKNQKCTKLHVCNRALKRGRACGLRNHTSDRCENVARMD